MGLAFVRASATTCVRRVRRSAPIQPTNNRIFLTKTSASSSLRRLALAALAAGTLATAAAPHARAALAVTDQANTSGNTNFSNGAAPSVQTNIEGQSFTPTLAAMDAATFSLLDKTAAPATVTLSVYAGAGFGGTLLGTSALVTFTNPSFATVEFDLPSVLLLTPGSTYTLGLTLAANTGIQGQVSTANPYTGGSLYFFGSTQPTVDAVFAEGVTSASLLPTGVPEPSTWAAVALGAGLLGVVTRRRAV